MAAHLAFSYTERALGFLEALPKKQRRQINEKIARLAGDPKPAGCKLVQGVQDGGQPVYRIRQGDYRVLYVVREPTIVILDIGHRKDVYN